jgi:hypothetical protein
VHINVSKIALAAAVAPLIVAGISVATAVAVPMPGFVAQPLLTDDNDGEGVGSNTGSDADFWNGGEAAGGTGPASSSPDTGDGPGYFDGGNPAGGTGPADSGPDTGQGPGVWDGGQSAGAV